MLDQKKEYFYWNNLPFGIPSNISDLEIKEKSNLLKKWETAIWTKNVQTDEQKLRNIKELPAVKIKVPEWIMDRLKESADHFVKGQWLSTISLSGVICEFLTYHFLEKHIKDKGIDKVIEHSRKLSRQKGRLHLLKSLKLIKESNWKKLDEIREIRNKYIHLNKIDLNEESAKEASLTVLKNLIEFLNSEKPLFSNYTQYSKIIQDFNKEVDGMKK